MAKRLCESLLENDLQYLIDPIISVNEYKSKIDEDGIVVVFYGAQKDASYDLSEFIEMGPTYVNDTEVGDVPNEDGKYEIFIEFERNAGFVKSLWDILHDVKYLTGIEEWEVRIFKEKPKKIKI